MTKTTLDASVPTFSQGKKTSKWVLFDWWDGQGRLVRGLKKVVVLEGEKKKKKRNRK